MLNMEEQMREDHSSIPVMDVSDISRKYLDIPYMSGETPQSLDIYLPESGKGPFPVIVNIHGGGFEVGAKNELMMRPLLDGALKSGYAYVCVDYTLGATGCFPRVVYEVKTAIRFLRANAEAYRLDAARIGSIGSSAGGYLSLVLASTGGLPMYEDLTMGNAEFDSSVKCAVGEYGIYNIAANNAWMQENHFADEELGRPDELDNMLCASLSGNPSLGAFANVFQMIHAGMPPVLLQHGIADHATASQQSVYLHRAICQLCGPDAAQLDLFEGNGHVGPAFYTDENIARLIGFFDRYLK